MQITQTFTWPAMNWPGSTPSTQYTVLQLYPSPNGNSTVVTTVTGTTSAVIPFDDTQNLVFQVRPSSGDGVSVPLTYGPEAGVLVVGYVPCRALIRQKVRYALADVTVYSWTDAELNGYIQEAIGELNVTFPIERDTTISLAAPTIVNGLTQGVRDYSLPTDFYLIRSVQYMTADGRLRLFLKEKPFIGGESTATSYLGYPKLGITINPVGGRYYVGHFDIYEGMLHLDWDPAGDGDALALRYLAKRPLPQGDGDLLLLTAEDLELVNLHTQMSAWLRLEGSDTRLSRFRDKSDGSKRDDMPTAKMSDTLKRLYDQRVNDRRELRPRMRRMVRR